MIEKTVMVGNKTVKVVEQAYLSDEDGTMSFTIWEEWIQFFKKNVEEGKVSFCLNYLLVKEFRDEIVLSTCSDSSCLVCSLDVKVKAKKNDVVFLKEFESVKDVLYQYDCSNVAWEQMRPLLNT